MNFITFTEKDNANISAYKLLLFFFFTCNFILTGIKFAFEYLELNLECLIKIKDKNF